MTERRIRVFDTTLRDGDQAPLVNFTLDEKLKIADTLASLRVDIIEAGFPAASQTDFDACRRIAENMAARRSGEDTPLLAVMSRCCAPDIIRSAEALSCDNRGIIHLSLPVSDLHIEKKLGLSRNTLIKKAVESVRLACGYAASVEMGAEDATRADPHFLVEYCRAVCDAGAKIVNIADTVGEATPVRFNKLIAHLMKHVEAFATGSAVLSIHCHNDLGLATANTLSGILAGAGQIEVSIAGIGERGGNASLEEIAAVLQNPDNAPGCRVNLDTGNLYTANRLVCGILGTGIQPFRPVWGSTTAAHASGIHQHGLSLSRHTYQSVHGISAGFPQQRTILSRHSGKAGVLSYLNEYAAITPDTTDKTVLEQAVTIIMRLYKDRESVEPGEIHQILSRLGLYTGTYLQAKGILEVSTISDGTGHDTVSVTLSDTAKKTEATGETIIKALSSLITTLGGKLPEVLFYSTTGGQGNWRVYLETDHPVKKNSILAFERTGTNSACTLFKCLLDAANTAAVLDQ